MNAPFREKLTLSPLPKTWILDLDGTLVKHNGHLSEEGDQLLPWAQDFFARLSDEDMIVVITSRPEERRGDIERFLAQNGVRFNALICGAPYGERVLVNDRKPSGLTTAYAINCTRDACAGIDYEIDESL